MNKGFFNYTDDIACHMHVHLEGDKHMYGLKYMLFEGKKFLSLGREGEGRRGECTE